MVLEVSVLFVSSWRRKQPPHAQRPAFWKSPWLDWCEETWFRDFRVWSIHTSVICHLSLILFHVNCMTWPLCELFAIHALPVPSPGPTHAMHELLFPVSSLDISGPIASLQQLWFPSAIKVCCGCKHLAFVWASAASSVLSTVSTASAVLAESTPEPWLLPDDPLSQAGRSCWKQRLINSYQIIPDFLTTSDIQPRPGLTSNQAVHLSSILFSVGICWNHIRSMYRISYLSIKQ